MARDRPASYLLLDPDLSFVAGTGTIDKGTGTVSPPHGPSDIASATRHAFCYGGASVIVSQLWTDADAPAEVDAAPADPILFWRIPHDEAFYHLRVTVDYIANAVVATPFYIELSELAESRNLPASVNAAGAVRRVTLDCDFTGAMDRTYGSAWHTLNLYAQGTGAVANPIVGVHIERLPVEDPIDSGFWYDSTLEIPDSSAFVEDAPLCTDKMLPLISAPTIMAANRHRTWLNWAQARNSTGVDADSMISTMIPVVDDAASGSRFGYSYLSSGTLDVYGGRRGIGSSPLYGVEVTDAAWKNFTAFVDAGDPMIVGDQRFQQIVADPSSYSVLKSLSLAGK